MGKKIWITFFLLLILAGSFFAYQFIFNENSTQISKAKTSTCDPSDKRSRLLCYEKLALSENDINVCNGLQELWERGSCKSYFARVKKDHSLCEEIERDWNKDACYFHIANDERDISLCDRILDTNSLEACYREIKEKEPKTSNNFLQA